MSELKKIRNRQAKEPPKNTELQRKRVEPAKDPKTNTYLRDTRNYGSLASEKKDLKRSGSFLKNVQKGREKGDR